MKTTDLMLMLAGISGSARSLLQFIPDREWPAILNYTSTYDCTAAVTAALATGPTFAPAGLYNINPQPGVVLPLGFELACAGSTRTIFRGMDVGATTDDLAGYANRGSLFRRDFRPGARTNPYVTSGRISGCSIITSHRAQQIGLDLRHISRSVIERVYVGTEVPVDEFRIKGATPAERVIGYGIVMGTRSSSEVDYCGGEANVLRDCNVGGAEVCYGIDVPELTPLSASHATVLDNCEATHGRVLVLQGSRYTAGFSTRGLLLQGTQACASGIGEEMGISVAGYDSEVHIRYAELPASCAALVDWAPTAQGGRSWTLTGSMGSAGIKAYRDRAADANDNRSFFKLPGAGWMVKRGSQVGPSMTFA